MNLADVSVFISCAMSLAVFDIRKPIENGRVIEPVFGALSGTVRCVGCPTTISGLAHYCQSFAPGFPQGARELNTAFWFFKL